MEFWKSPPAARPPVRAAALVALVRPAVALSGCVSQQQAERKRAEDRAAIHLAEAQKQRDQYKDQLEHLRQSTEELTQQKAQLDAELAQLRAEAARAMVAPTAAALAPRAGGSATARRATTGPAGPATFNK
jgi:septal ring factor EnvC (AmiA/AmiB activator)